MRMSWRRGGASGRGGGTSCRGGAPCGGAEACGGTGPRGGGGGDACGGGADPRGGDAGGRCGRRRCGTWCSRRGSQIWRLAWPPAPSGPKLVRPGSPGGAGSGSSWAGWSSDWRSSVPGQTFLVADRNAAFSRAARLALSELARSEPARSEPARSEPARSELARSCSPAVTPPDGGGGGADPSAVRGGSGEPEPASPPEPSPWDGPDVGVLDVGYSGAESAGVRVPSRGPGTSGRAGVSGRSCGSRGSGGCDASCAPILPDGPDGPAAGPSTAGSACGPAAPDECGGRAPSRPCAFDGADDLWLFLMSQVICSTCSA